MGVKVFPVNIFQSVYFVSNVLNCLEIKNSKFFLKEIPEFAGCSFRIIVFVDEWAYLGLDCRA